MNIAGDVTTRVADTVAVVAAAVAATAVTVMVVCELLLPNLYCILAITAAATYFLAVALHCMKFVAFAFEHKLRTTYITKARAPMSFAIATSAAVVLPAIHAAPRNRFASVRTLVSREYSMDAYDPRMLAAQALLYAGAAVVTAALIIDNAYLSPGSCLALPVADAAAAAILIAVSYIYSRPQHRQPEPQQHTALPQSDFFVDPGA